MDLAKFFKKQKDELGEPLFVPSPFKHRPVGVSDFSPSNSRQPPGFREHCEQIQKERDQELAELEQRRKEAREAKAQAAQGKLLCPGVKKLILKRKGGRPPTGKKTGKAIGLKSNRRELGAPVLRRDPRAQDKVYMVKLIEIAMKTEGVQHINDISTKARRDWQERLNTCGANTHAFNNGHD